MTIITERTARDTKRKKSGHATRLTLHYLIGDKTVCEVRYRLTADTRFIEIPLPVCRLLVAS